MAGHRSSLRTILLRALVGVAPPIIIGIWSVAYLRDCWVFLTSPGVPIEFSVNSPSGALKFTAQSFDLSVAQGEVRLLRPRLFDPTGRLLASAETASVTNLDLRRGSEQAPNIKIVDLYGRLTRLKGGRFQIEDFVPRQVSSGAGIPYEVTIDHATCDVVDETGSAPFSLRARSPFVRVAGRGTDWFASGSGDVLGVGSLRVRLHRLANQGLIARFDTPGLQLASVIAHVQSTPDGERFKWIRSLRMRSALASGAGQLTLGNNRKFAIQAEGQAVAQGASYASITGAQAAFKGRVTDSGCQGNVEVSLGKNHLIGDGSLLWKPRLSGGLNAVAHVVDSNGLPLRSWITLPPGVGFSDARYEGWVSIAGPGAVSIDGQIQAHEIRTKLDRIESLRASVTGDRSRLLIRISKVGVVGQTLSAVASVRPDVGQVSAGITVSTLDLRSLSKRIENAKRTELSELRGTGSAAFSVVGPFSKPQIEFAADTSVRYEGRHPIDLQGSLETSGSLTLDLARGLRQSALSIDRGAFLSRSGDLYVTGRTHSDQSIDFDIVGRDLRPGAYLDKVGGIANLQGKVTGSLTRPILDGRVEAYQVTVRDQQAPLITANISANRDKIALQDIRAIKGSAQATGNIALAVNDQTLHGSMAVQGLQLADIDSAFGRKDANLVGILDAPSIQISGTLSHPVAKGELKGSSLLVGGVKLDELHASGEYDGFGVAVGSAQTKLGSGTVDLSAVYQSDSQTTKVSGEAKSVSLNLIADALGNASSFDGEVDGKLELTLHQAGLVEATGSGHVSSMIIDGTELGNGPWTIKGDPEHVFADLDVGVLDRYVSMQNLEYDFAKASPTIEGTVDTSNFPLQDIVSASLRYFPNLSYDAVSVLRSIQGSLNASVKLSGEAKSPSISCDTFEVSNIEVKGDKIGKLTLQGRRDPGGWTLDNLLLSAGSSRLTLSGTAFDDGDLKADGELSDLDISQLGVINPSIANYSGKISASFLASGPLKSPTIRASVSASGLFAEAAQANDDRSLRFEIAPLTISESEPNPSGGMKGGIEFSGSYFYRGFVGSLSAQIPLKYPFQVLDDAPIAAKIVLQDRSIQDIASLVGGVNPQKSDGQVGGEISASGTLSDLRYVGNLHVDATKLAINDLDTEFRQLKASLSLDGQSVELMGDAKSDMGGGVSIDVKARENQFSDLIQRIRTDGFRSLLPTRIGGSVVLDTFGLRKSFPGKAYIEGYGNGTISVTGSVRRPSITGALALSGVDMVVPSSPPNPATSNSLLVDPDFNVTVKLPEPARVRASTADLSLDGAGSLQGSLSRPQVHADLAVDKGQLRLPAAIIRLDPGGTVAFDYQTEREASLARLNVNLLGRTQVTTNTPGTAALERYDVTLGVQGDLLSDSPLSLTASSDPPDLTQDRIFALLGQTDLLESLNSGSGVARGTAQRQFQSALVGVAFPSVFGSITSSVAKSLGLDYFELAYSQYDQASVSFAKSVGSAFTIQGTRQVNQPPPGYPFQYDYRLVYRPRGVPGFLQRFSLSVGTDQDRPYKLGLEYGTRF